MKDDTIASPVLHVSVNPCGAELKSIEKNGLEYLWQGDETYYSRTSPVLFPVVGRFLSDVYFVGDKPYQMPLNGIVMNRNFGIESRTSDGIVLVTQSDARTLRQFPYPFRLTVGYRVSRNRVTVSQAVDNIGKAPLPFIIGTHTAYRWPLYAGENARDYFLRFEQEETLESFNPFGWRDSFMRGSDEKPLDHALFENFTRSVTGLRSQWVELASRVNSHRVRIYRGQYPYMAIWTAPQEDAAFICLEPCTGIQPGDRGCTTMLDRDGVQVLAPGETSRRSFVIEID